MVGKYKYDFNIPEAVKNLLNKLHTKYEAYIVGGCVRDLLLNKNPKDYDITTNATPEQIKEVFKDKDYTLINNNGEKHGTVTVRYKKENYEITTYRLDGEYTDHRHPDEVTFTTNLQEDLSRRDFTINALVYDGKYVIDYFGGITDLENKIIKTVGNPYYRFDEDALRILRMLRFASVLDFEIEDNTLLAAEELKNNLFTIAKERKTTELNKLVCGKGFARILNNVLAYNILKQVLPLNDTHLYSMNLISRIFNSDPLFNRDYILSYCLLFNRIESRHLLFNYLILSNEDKDYINDICRTVTENSEIIGGKYQYLQLSHEDVDRYIITKALHELKHNDNKDYCYYVMVSSIIMSWVIGNISGYKATKLRNDLEDIVRNGCYSLKQLAINGNDLIELGLEPGPVIKDILEGYLNDVIEGKVENTKEVLIEKVKFDIVNKIRR